MNMVDKDEQYKVARQAQICTEMLEMAVRL